MMEHNPTGAGSGSDDPELDLITRYAAKELSVEQTLEVESRLASDAAFRRRVQPVLDCLMHPADFSEEFAVAPSALRPAFASDAAIEAGWQRYRGDRLARAARVNRIATPPWRRNIWRIAAAIAIVAVPLTIARTTDLLYGLEGPPGESPADKLRAIFDRTRATTAPSETRRVDIGDGSAVELGPQSTMVYRPQGTENGRPVNSIIMSLRGEAVIEVTEETHAIYLGTPVARARLSPGRYRISAIEGDTAMTVSTESGWMMVLPRGARTGPQFTTGQSGRVVRPQKQVPRK